jgi:inhibitor of cysteine peptidase
MKRRIYNDILHLVFFLFLAAIASLSGCAGGTEIGNPQARSFSSDQELTAYLKDQYAQSAQATALWALDNDAQPGWTNSEIYAGEKGYSTTNIQETGVDESDMIKTDGTYLYAAGNREVRVISAKPAESMQVISRITVNGRVDSIYLYNTILTILYVPEDGQGIQWAFNDNLKMIDVGMPYWKPVEAKIGVLIADVSSPSDPIIMKDFQADGYFVSSRLTAGKIHVISQFIPKLPPLNLWYDGTPSGKEATVESNRATLEPLTLDDYLPSYSLFDGNGVLETSGRLIALGDFIRPETPAGGTIVSVVTMDMNDLTDDFSSIGFIADIHHVYASTQNIYLISTLYQGEPAIKAPMDSDIYQTRIYQLDISGEKAAFSAEGLVNGHILNQFSLGEYNDVLRIATTTGYAWDGSAANHVYCLKKNDGQLAVIGRLENLASGERLYSARFIGDRGFLVTFVEVDPLFTLNLSDPQNPALVGELKVPGYSTYLHPIGDDYLLAIGKDTATDTGAALYQGLQISIFDISDFTAPKLVATKKIGDRGTDSEALFNHKALTFWPEKNLLALPVSLYEFPSPPEDPWEYGTNTFNGLYVYRLTDTHEFKYLGRMEMTDAGDIITAPSWIRGVFMEDDVYAVSADRVKAAAVNSISEPFFNLSLSE